MIVNDINMDCMTHFYRRGLLLFVAFLAAFGLQAEEPEYLYVRVTGGEIMKYPIEQFRKITFADDAMLLYQVGTEQPDTYPFTDFLVLAFSEAGGAFVEAPEAGAFSVVYDRAADAVRVTSQPGTARLFDLQGRMLQTVALQDTESLVPMQEYPSGVYVVRVETGSSVQIQKIVKP